MNNVFCEVVYLVKVFLVLKLKMVFLIFCIVFFVLQICLFYVYFGYDIENVCFC